MKNNIKKFIIRGAAFAWGGPAVLAIVWKCIELSGESITLSVNEAALGIISTCVMAFIAAGVTVVYQIEELPKALAALIQFSVLYIDYLGFYLLNGWIKTDVIFAFTAIFVTVFLIIWFTVYLAVKLKVSKINKMMNAK